MAKKVTFETRAITFIKAYDMEDTIEPQDIFLFYAIHLDTVDLRIAVKKAFSAWAKTDAGKEFINTSGTNWGDALEIPSEFLQQEGIQELGAVVAFRNGRKICLVTEFDAEIVVNHNESLVDKD